MVYNLAFVMCFKLFNFESLFTGNTKIMYHGREMISMTRKKLSEDQIENLIELIDQRQLKLKKRNEQLKLTRQKLNNAKQTVQRLQLAVTFQPERILDLHRAVR